MGEGSNLHGRSFEEVLEAIFESTEELLLVDPTATAVRALTAVTTAADDPPTVRLLAASGLLKTVLDDFVVASNAADHVADGGISVRTDEVEGANALAVTEEAVWALVAVDDHVAALGTDDAEFVATAGSAHEARWDEATSFDLRTPPLSRVRSTLAEEIGEDVRADFDAALDALSEARDTDAEFDEVTLSILVAAHNDVLLYDISKWGEDVGIASKATFSRTKTALEDAGLIRTEKVPIDVGRPRLRLKLDEGRFESATPSDLATATLSFTD
jgi:hypothetical protein